MISSLSIENFRGFKRFTLGSLERINLVAGANDVGKTGLLEALLLLIGETNLSLTIRINALRGLDQLQGDADAVAAWAWRPLFNSFDTSQRIKIEGKLTDQRTCRAELRLVPLPSTRVTVGEQVREEAIAEKGVSGFSTKALQVEYSTSPGEHSVSQLIIDQEGIRIVPPPPAPTYPGSFLPARGRTSLAEDAKCYGQLEVEKSPFDPLAVLKLVEPRLTRIVTVVGVGGAMLWGDIGQKDMLPLALMGDGLSRIASIVLRIATSRHGYVLIDEIENGLHYSILPKVWSALAEAARDFDIQLFATTHSRECIQSAHEAFSASAAYDFRLHRLDRLNGDIRAVTYDKEMLDTALLTGLEVR